MTDLHPRHLCDFPAEPCRCAQILATVEGEPAPVGRHEAALRDLRAWLDERRIYARDSANRTWAVEGNRTRYLTQVATFQDVIAKLDELAAK